MKAVFITEETEESMVKGSAAVVEREARGGDYLRREEPSGYRNQSTNADCSPQYCVLSVIFGQNIMEKNYEKQKTCFLFPLMIKPIAAKGRPLGGL